jgi:hypothetical protein
MLTTIVRRHPHHQKQLRRIVSFVGAPSQRELDSFVTSAKAKSFIMGLPASPKVDLRKRCVIGRGVWCVI